MKLLAVIDMQNDFVTGALGTPQAQAILPAVKKRVEQALAEGAALVFTQDTHGPQYPETQEGRRLPVPHCIQGTPGWEIVPALRPYLPRGRIFEKPSFGSWELAAYAREKGFDQIEVIGLCTDICVLSNVLLLKAALPEAEILVDSACCAGVTPQSHENALSAMKICQVTVV